VNHRGGRYPRSSRNRRNEIRRISILPFRPLFGSGRWVSCAGPAVGNALEPLRMVLERVFSWISIFYRKSRFRRFLAFLWPSTRVVRTAARIVPPLWRPSFGFFGGVPAVRSRGRRSLLAAGEGLGGVPPPNRTRRERSELLLGGVAEREVIHRPHCVFC
jgi:hypothetical protein